MSDDKMAEAFEQFAAEVRSLDDISHRRVMRRVESLAMRNYAEMRAILDAAIAGEDLTAERMQEIRERARADFDAGRA